MRQKAIRLRELKQDAAQTLGKIRIIPREDKET